MISTQQGEPMGGGVGGADFLASVLEDMVPVMLRRG